MVYRQDILQARVRPQPCLLLCPGCPLHSTRCAATGCARAEPDPLTPPHTYALLATPAQIPEPEGLPLLPEVGMLQAEDVLQPRDRQQHR